MSLDATERSVIRWLANGEVGRSSQCMALWLGFEMLSRDVSHPHDPGDFNRCLKLLREAPELRERFGRLRALSKEWGALASRWSEVEALFLEEAGLDWSKALTAPRTYALLRDVLSAAPSAPIVFDPEPACSCHRCRRGLFLVPRFIVCPDCGNKRCPRAADHDLACTGSNATGQPGSAYP